MSDLPVYCVPAVIMSRASCPVFPVGLVSIRNASFAELKNIGRALILSLSSDILFVSYIANNLSPSGAGAFITASLIQEKKM